MNEGFWQSATPVIAMFLCLIGVPVTHAQECLAPGPSVLAGIDIYEPVRTRKLTSEEHRNLERLFKTLERNWDGTGEALICLGKKGAIRERFRNYAVDAKVDINASGTLTIDADLYDEKDRVTQNETIRLFFDDDRLLANRFSAGDVELIDISPTRLVFLQKYRQQQVAGTGGIMKEVLTIIDANSSQFSLERSVFTLGELSSWLYWRLTP